MLVMFKANWFGPSRMIEAHFDAYEGKFHGKSECVFAKVDIDENDDLATELGVNVTPTFQVWKGGEKVEELVGADATGLKALVEKYV